MIIDEGSPFRRLPSELDRRQALFLDGIRYSVEMADLAHTRLRQTLFDIAKEQNRGAQANHWSLVSAVQDAWSVVDSLHRLRGLLDQMPGSKKKGPGLQVFVRTTTGIEDLRNAVQHLNHEIDGLVARNQPVWGSLSWFAALDPFNNFGASCSLITGTLFVKAASAPMIMPEGEVDLPVNLIVLSAYGHSLNLSDAMRRVARLIAGMENELKEQFSGYSTAGADLITCVGLQFGGGEPEEAADS